MKRLKSLALAASTLILAACTTTGDAPEPNPNPTPTGKGFIKIAITSNNGIGTRAGEDVTKIEECSIKDITLAFYDKDGLLITQTTIDKGALLNPTDKGSTANYGETIEIPLSPLSSDQTEDRSVVCYINTGTSFQAPATLGETTTVASWLNGAYYLMSSSVYFDENGKLVNSSKLGKVYESKAGADKSTDVNEVTQIYVDRVASKTQLTAAEGIMNTDQKDLTGNALEGLIFVIDKWALTATANESYLLKQFGSYTKETLNTMFSGKADLFEEHRTNWAIPVYFETTTTPALTHLNYKNVSDKGKTIGESNWDYCLEHSLKDPGSNLYNNTALLIAGHYTIRGVESQDLFTYGLTGGESQKPNVYTQNNLLDKIAFDFQIKKGENTATSTDLEEILEFAPQSVSTVKLNIKSGSSTDGFTILGKPLTQENLEARAANMPKIRMYAQGKGYYWVPIEHFGTTNGIQTGSYGVIRNNAYQVKITGIAKLAAPVANAEAEIIPEEEETLHALKFNITVQDWKTWTVQETVLGK